MKLPFTRTGFSVMDINNALLLGIIELICYLNLNYGGFSIHVEQNIFYHVKIYMAWLQIPWLLINFLSAPKSRDF